MPAPDIENYQPIQEEFSSRERIEVEKDLFSWTAPARPFKRRNREFYVTVIAMAAVVGLVFFIAEGVMPVILLASLIFLFYVLSTVEPENIEYRITSHGIRIADRLTEWGEITRFWFGRRFDSDLLIFEINRIPGRLELVVKPDEKDQIRDVLTKYLNEEKVSPSGIDKATTWIAKRLPGN